MSGEGELVLAGLNGLTVDLVCPTTVVSEDSSGFSDIETLGNSKGLSVVEGFKGSKDIDISLHQGSDLHEQLASLETWDVETPGGVEGIVSGIKSDLDVGSETLGDLDEDLTSGGVVDAGYQHMMRMNSRNTHSMVFALESLDSDHSLLMNSPVGTSTLPLKPAWLNS